MLVLIISCIITCTSGPVAGAVSTVSTSQVSDDVVRVNWSAPEAVNGILQQYVLVYREYDRPSSDVEVSVSLPATSFDIPGLCEPIKFTANYALAICTIHLRMYIYM